MFNGDLSHYYECMIVTKWIWCYRVWFIEWYNLPPLTLMINNWSLISFPFIFLCYLDYIYSRYLLGFWYMISTYKVNEIWCCLFEHATNVCEHAIGWKHNNGGPRLLSRCIIFQGYHIWISTIHVVYCDNYKFFY
jgi:hypothetical protein